MTSYFAPNARWARPDEFRAFVDTLHDAGIGVLLDWVPAHFPQDDWALRRFDGTALYEHEDPRRGAHPDWGTLVFNFGRNEVRNFLLASALYWMREHHADGIRVDAVASMLYLDYSREEGQWIPNQFGGNEDLDAVSFLKEMNETLHGREPGVISAAEESTVPEDRDDDGAAAAYLVAFRARLEGRQAGLADLGELRHIRRVVHGGDLR